MAHAMDDHDEQCLDGISDEVAVPQEVGSKVSDEPKHGNDRHGASHHMAMNNSLDYYVDKLKTIVKK